MTIFYSRAGLGDSYYYFYFFFNYFLMDFFFCLFSCLLIIFRLVTLSLIFSPLSLSLPPSNSHSLFLIPFLLYHCLLSFRLLLFLILILVIPEKISRDETCEARSRPRRRQASGRRTPVCGDLSFKIGRLNVHTGARLPVSKVKVQCTRGDLGGREI